VNDKMNTETSIHSA